MENLTHLPVSVHRSPSIILSLHNAQPKESHANATTQKRTRSTKRRTEEPASKIKLQIAEPIRESHKIHK